MIGPISGVHVLDFLQAGAGARPTIARMPRFAEFAARAWSGATVGLKSQPIGERLWRDAPQPTLRRRRLYGYEMMLDVSRSNAQRVLYLDGERFIPDRALAASLVQSGAAAMDVGANIGYYMLLLQRLGASRVICVEPDAENLMELRRTIAANRFTNVEVVVAAAGPVNGQALLKSGLNARVVSGGDRQVAMVRVDDIAPDDLGFLKIDVEGYERLVLDGAQRVMRNQVNLLVEIHPPLLSLDEINAIISNVRNSYDDVTIWALPELGGRLSRPAARLRGARPVPIADWQHLSAPFWLTARA